MIVYRGTKDEFAAAVRRDTLAPQIEQAVLERLGRHTAPAEYDSWRNSSHYMRDALDAADLPGDCGIAIEYQVPSTSKRIDYLISGRDEGGAAQIVLVELKQWSSVEMTRQEATVRTFVGGAVRPMAHPSYQVWSYAQLLENFNEAVESSRIALHPCAFLHNYPTWDAALTDPVYSHYLTLAPVFRMGEGPALGQYIGGRVANGDGGAALEALENGRIRPSKSLVDALEKMLKGNEEFVLIDDQKVVFEAVRSEVARAQSDKAVFIIEGGPGTGKSVVAINLLASLLGDDQNAQYVTRNSAPREVFQAKLTGSFRKSAISLLFRSSGAFIGTPSNSIDALIVDESHRLTEKSGMYYDGENQIKELINAARTSVFFIDDDQRVTMRDIGSVAEIERIAQEANATIHRYSLPSQFRCNGSDGYVAWVDDVLGIRETANPTLDGIDYDFRVYDDPNALYAEIRRLNAEGAMSRVLAGYCWDWKTKKQPFAWDIELPEFGFRMRWNDFDLGQSWIMHDESIDQIGCIHTSQGLEVAYVGVIIGPDLRMEDGELVTDPYTHPGRDKNLQGFKGRMKSDSAGTMELTDRLIRNTYRTLMTRGMKGCFVFCVDKALACWIRERMGPLATPV
ncbi:MAG: DNA/RNA helicase domain-containing protein [Burkholderiaceae bacterium]